MVLNASVCAFALLAGKLWLLSVRSVCSHSHKGIEKRAGIWTPKLKLLVCHQHVFFTCVGL